MTKPENPGHTENHHTKGTDTPPSAEALIEQISSDDFAAWYREREFRRNIQEKQSYFNGPGSVSEPDRHSPSQLLQCHRKIVYRKENAPVEQPDPNGIFWFGTKFEEELLFPYLERAVTGTETYVQNSLWIDFTEETEAGELHIKGSTDPVIVDSDAVPILPTEVKTKSSTDNVTEPNRHHRAQVHAYLIGLSEKFDREFTDAILVYGGRDDLEIKPFHVEFDPDFWDNVVLNWAAQHTQYQLDGDLPPADPEYEWECRFCSYRHRCGKADTPFEDHGSHGLLPGFDEYPRQNVMEYLESHPSESLTPTLALKYPDLAVEYDVIDWFCRTCDSIINWKEPKTVEDPICPSCAERGEITTLSLPTPDER